MYSMRWEIRGRESIFNFKFTLNTKDSLFPFCKLNIYLFEEHLDNLKIIFFNWFFLNDHLVNVHNRIQFA